MRFFVAVVLEAQVGEGAQRGAEHRHAIGYWKRLQHGEQLLCADLSLEGEVAQRVGAALNDRRVCAVLRHDPPSKPICFLMSSASDMLAYARHGRAGRLDTARARASSGPAWLE